MDKIDIVPEVRKRKEQLSHEIKQLSEAKNEPERKKALETISQKVEDLKLFVSQNIPGRISYEVSNCNALIKELDQQLAKERDSKRTSFKFSFNLKDKLSSKKKTTEASTKDSADSVDTSALNSLAQKGIKNLKDVEKTMTNEEVDQQDLVLESLDNCTVYIHGSPQSIRLVKLHNCKIFSGPVSTSVFITDCHQCEFQIIAQQIRIHDSTQCDVFQHINSRSIIENCRQFRFGPYSYGYKNLQPDFAKSTIDPQINNWQQIDDFDCLTNPSPNWSLIDK